MSHNKKHEDTPVSDEAVEGFARSVGNPALAEVSIENNGDGADHEVQRDEPSGDVTTHGQSPTHALAGSIGKKVVRPLLVGSAINLALEAPKSEKRTFAQNAAQVVGWSAIVGAGVDLVSTGGAQLLVEGAEHGFESQAHFVVSDLLPNPLTYLAVFGGVDWITKISKIAGKKIPAAFEATKAHIRKWTTGMGRHVRAENTPDPSPTPSEQSAE